MAKPPDYRLQVLLELRERKEDEAERALGAAVAAHQEEVAKQHALERELARMVVRRQQKERDYAERAMRGEQVARDAVGAAVFLVRLKEQEQAQKDAIEAQGVVVGGRAREVDTARRALVAASRELRALEKHKEELVGRWKRAQAAKDEVAMDELAQQLFREGERR